MVKSFVEYWEQVKAIRYDADKEIVFSRGQSNGEYDKILPGICRDRNDDERQGYQQIQIEYPEEFKKHEHLSNLIKMQHYGCKTRLLDFSLNPLVSLYFACEEDPDKNGKVFSLVVPKKDIIYHNSDRALMLSCLPLFSKKDQDEIKSFCQTHRGVITDQDIAFSDVMRRFLHEIRGECPAFETEIVGEDLLKYFFLVPHKDNERMKVQSGVFALFGLDEDALVDELNGKLEPVIEIEASAKKEILRDLSLICIDSATMYPGLERRAMLQRGKKTKWVNI